MVGELYGFERAQQTRIRGKTSTDSYQLPCSENISLSELTAPDLTNTKTYKEFVHLLIEHLDPKPNEISERHNFAQSPA
jgi:hypothetical protein